MDSVVAPDSGTSRLELPIGGMSCASCVRRVERVAAGVPGVRHVSVNLATERASLEAGPEFRLPELAAALASAGYAVGTDEVDLAITGMSCASCAGRVERALLHVPGVLEAAVNPTTERARIRTVAGAADTDALIAAVVAAGYGASWPEAERKPGTRPDSELGLLLLAGVGAASLGLPMLDMRLAFPPGIQLAVAALVQFVCGARFYRGGWAALRAGTGNMDLLVALGTSAAFALSAWQVLAGHAGAHLYFEASAAVIALVRLGKLLERRARRQAGDALRALARLRPERARVRLGEGEQEVPTGALRPGDVVVIRPGERIPADGVVLEGEGSADESLLTGESLPLSKQPGSRLVGGSLNGEALLVSEVTAPAAEGQLAQMIRLVEAAQAAKPPIQRLVDRVSAVFVPVVLGIAALTLACWLLAGVGLETALVNAVAVLVIACPCALGLATPAAIVVGTGVAARHGILIRDPAALEQARGIRTVVFDKTGTLTEGRPALVAARPAPGVTEAELLAKAGSVQRGSEHPLAAAVLARVPEGVVASGVRALPGRGLEGTLEGRKILLGNARLMRERGVPLSESQAESARLEADGRTVSFVAEDDRLLGLLAFGDQIRDGAPEAVAQLVAQGLAVALLTGDSRGAGEATGRALGITDVRAEALPADKVQTLTLLRGAGAVAMVGDGVNDAAALAAADLGIAFSSGTDVAASAAGIVLMRADPRLVPAALDIAARTAVRIRSGLFWAFFYNVVGIPLAAAGLLSPVIAGAAMALSSLSVVGSALLLRRWPGERMSHAGSEMRR
ncbi:MAG: copper-translocating P-type ATPase [Acetobacteraceae bacterium]|nr:copper-translocating P-type ATPase [Acetobacteraceae bacterium]